MMNKILICCLVRDIEKNFELWVEQLNNLVETTNNCSFNLALFENDSKDYTKTLINNRGFFSRQIQNFYISTNVFNHRKYGAVNNRQRVMNLSFYRNKCIENLTDENYFLFIESDIQYDKNLLNDLLASSQELSADIISPYSYNTTLKEFYDGWGTRMKKGDKNFIDHKYSVFDNSIFKVYSTFNCFCLYKNHGIKDFFDFKDMYADTECDTYVACEKYQNLGYNNIYLDTRYKILHP